MTLLRALWRRLGALAIVALALTRTEGAAPLLTIETLPTRQVRLGWMDPGGSFVLEQTDRLLSPVDWQPVAAPLVAGDGRVTVVLEASGTTRYFRLRGASAPVPPAIVATSPTQGESGVAVTRETIIRLSTPLAPDTVLSPDALRAEAGGRRLLTRAELSSDRLTLTLFNLENLPASTRVRVSLDGTNLAGVGGLMLDADGDGVPGGVGYVEFDTATTKALAGTAVTGHVYASERNADGSNRPLPNVTITVDGAEETLRTTTDSRGFFRLEPAPAGRFFVHVDGRTATGSRWPGGAYYPFVGKAWEAVAGRTNNPAGGSGEIFLPLIQADALQPVSATQDTQIKFSPAVVAANPSLADVEITVPANALFSDNGTRGGKVGLAPVPADRLPEPLPPGLNLPLVVTVQTDGGMNFDQPVPVKFPNLRDPATGILPGPGEKTVLWSFNHDTGRWEPQGTLTISADGRSAVSDPGVGIRQPGWHGTSPGGPATGPQTCQGKDCEGPDCGTLPPQCCLPWDEMKKPCERKRQLALNATFDLAVDGLDFALEIFPGGCLLTGGPMETAKTARDCTAVGGDQFSKECADIASDNAIGFALSCVPVVGGVLDLGWSGKQLIDNTFNFKDCMDTIKAQCFPQPTGRHSLERDAAPQGATADYDPRLVQTVQELQWQYDLAIASSNLLATVFGDPLWAKAASPEAYDAYKSVFTALRSALAADGPDGRIANAAERTAILSAATALGASSAQAIALIDRMQGFGTGAFSSNAALRAQLAQAYAQFVDATDAVKARGWKDLFDGFRRAVVLLSSMNRPAIGDSLSAAGSAASPAAAPQSPLAAETLADAPAGFPRGPHFYLLRDHDNGFVRRGRLNANGQFEGVILRPDTLYSVAYCDATGERAGGTFFRSAAVGRTTDIPTAALYSLRGTPELAAMEPDRDADRLPDRIESILGTNARNADSDGDGIADGQELSLGSNPLDGTPAASGVIAGLNMRGIAVDVATTGNLLVLATSHALVVADITDPHNPVQMAAVPGSVSWVDARGTLALAAFANSVRLFDLTVPSAPKQLWTREDLSLASAVALGRTSVLVAHGGQLRRLDLTSGANAGSVTLAGVQSLEVNGNFIYALSAKLTALKDGDVLEILASTDAPGSGGAGGRSRRLAAAGNLLYAQHTSGCNVFDLSNPAAPTLLTDVKTTQFGWRHLVPTGSAMALGAVGPNSNDDRAQDVSLYRLTGNGTNIQLLATFETPGAAAAVAVAGGYGYVADGAAGLAVVNFLDPDLAGLAPTIALTVNASGTPPRIEGNSLVRFVADARDDIGVRYVDFFIDGQFVARDDSYPFELFHLTPVAPPGGTPLRLRARAVDMGGNSTESTELLTTLLPDATPPQIVAVDPPASAVIAVAVVDAVSVKFAEPVVTPASSTSLTLRTSGPDGVFGSTDDANVAGTVAFDAAARVLTFQSPTTFTSGRYRATLVGGLADADGNVRPAEYAWEFQTGPQPHVATLFPPPNYVRVGGVLEEIVLDFDQPVPKASAATYVWKLTRRPFLTDSPGSFGPVVNVTPLLIQQGEDPQRFTLRVAGGFPAGQYQLTGSGPNVQAMLYEFHFRDFPNVATGVFQAAGSGFATSWKYFPGPGVNDDLIVNLPGQVAPIDARNLHSLVAHTDIRLAQQKITIEEPVQAMAGLELTAARFAPGTTHVHGPLRLLSSTGFNYSELGSHVIHAYGGGLMRNAELRFPDPAGALVNHPGSVFVLSNGAAVANSGTSWSNAGRIVNLGTLRSQPQDAPATTLPFEDVRVRNEGRIEVLTGGLKFNSLENEGAVEVAAGARLFLPLRLRGGTASRLTGSGLVEFGQYNIGTRRVEATADAEIKGDIDASLGLKLVAGRLDLWKPLLRPSGSVELQNASTLHLLGTAEIGTVTITDGNLLLNSDTWIGQLDVGARADLRVATRLQIAGNVVIQQGLDVLGPGVAEFAGNTLVSNGTQSAAIYVGHATLRNTGTWRQAGGGNSGTSINGVRDDGEDGQGVFENAGVFEQTTDRLLSITARFRNAGRASLSRGPVTFDARTGTGSVRLGALLPQPGSELLLNGTDLQYGNAGTLDLAAGVLRGTGTITATPAQVINRASLQPGNPTGVLTIRATGGFEQTATGELVVTLAAADSSRLTLISRAALAGSLRVELASGFVPQAGQSFTVLSCSSRSGEFSNVRLPELPAGLKLTVAYQSTAVLLNVVAAQP